MANNGETISYIQIGENTHQIIDSTIPSWAKEQTKPEYTAEEVGALPNSTIIPSVDNYFDNVEYDSQNKRINFKHGTTVKKYIDASDFIKDGMVDSVSIASSGSDSDDNGVLIITFNTDAGKEDIEIPLNQVFDPSNYYSKRRADQVFVKYNTTQNLNDAHKSQARQNIGAGILNGVIFNGTSASVSNGIASISVSIPSEVTETTITGWGFTKNSGTLTSESDPIFTSSVAYTITSADISNWNSKTSNTGTLTGITLNGNSVSVSDGVAAITVAEVTEATVSGWGFTKNSGTLTSHAKHKLEIGSATATSAASNTITYVESLTGTTTATSGNLTITPTLKSISVPTVSQLVDELSSEFVKKPDIIYQYESGYSQIYGQGSDSFTNNWDLTNLDLSPYKYLKVFMKGSDHATNASALTAPIIITIPLDEGIIYSGTTVYYGVGVTLGINDQNRWFATFAGVDSTKTKFQILRTRSIYGTVGSNQDNNGRYLWRIEGWYDSEEAGESGSSSFTELDPTVPSYVKSILQSDINSWNGKLSGVTFNGVSASVSNGVASISAETLPSVSASDNGKVLMVDNGAWAKKDPVHLYSGSGTPSDLDGYDGDLYIDLT